MENSGRWEICKIDVHRASYAKHLRSKKQLENRRQDERIIPEWFFEEEQEPIKRKNLYNPKTVKQIARDYIELGDKEMKKKLAKEIIFPYNFSDGALNTGFNTNLDSQITNLATPIMTLTPYFPEFGIEFRYNEKLFK